MKFLAFLFLLSTAGFAETWSGFLVDAECWANRQSNVSADATTANRDMDMDVRYCSPTVHTKSFSLILYDWRGLKLDPEGNLRASQIVERGTRRATIYISVRGVLNKKTLSVTSISAPPLAARR